jgi:hypothetical protein
MADQTAGCSDILDFVEKRIEAHGRWIEYWKLCQADEACDKIMTALGRVWESLPYDLWNESMD